MMIFRSFLFTFTRSFKSHAVLSSVCEFERGELMNGLKVVVRLNPAGSDAVFFFPSSYLVHSLTLTLACAVRIGSNRREG